MSAPVTRPGSARGNPFLAVPEIPGTETHGTPLGRDDELLRGVAASDRQFSADPMRRGEYWVRTGNSKRTAEAHLARMIPVSLVAGSGAGYDRGECPLPSPAARPRDPAAEARVRRFRGTYAFIAGNISADEYRMVLSDTSWAYGEAGHDGLGAV